MGNEDGMRNILEEQMEKLKDVVREDPNIHIVEDDKPKGLRHLQRIREDLEKRK